MATSVLDTELLILIDNWPTFKVLETPPAGGFTGATNNAAAAAYPVGTKCTVQQTSGAGETGIPHGSSTFIYLMCDSNVATAPVLAVLGVCAPLAQSENGPGLTNYVVDNVTGNEATGMIGVALATMTNSYYGWFWCGGVAPVGHVVALAGDVLTVAVGAAEALMCAEVGDVANDPLGFDTATAGNVVCGIALHAEG